MKLFNKKIRKLTLVIFLIIIFTSCSSNDKEEINTIDNKDKINKKQEYIIKFKNNYEILNSTKLIKKAKTPNEFIPSDWELIDSIEVDFNKDELLDFIGVIEFTKNNDNNENEFKDNYPRIFFTAIKTENGEYKLSLQDNHIIRSKYEGGVFGDPYLPIEFRDDSLIIEFFGGSNSKWNEIYTIKYQLGDWNLTEFELTGSIGPYITYNYYDDYETGIGRRQYNSELPEKVENRVNSGYDSYDLSFNIFVDDVKKLNDYSESLKLYKPDFNEIKVEDIIISSKLKIEDEMSQKIKESSKNADRLVYIDKKNIVYTFSIKKLNSDFLAVIDRENKIVKIVDKAFYNQESFNNNFENVDVSDGELFYSIIKESEKTSIFQVIKLSLEELDKKIIISLDYDKKVNEDYFFFGTNLEVNKNMIYFTLYRGELKTFYSFDLENKKLEKIGSIK